MQRNLICNSELDPSFNFLGFISRVEVDLTLALEKSHIEANKIEDPVNRPPRFIILDREFDFHCWTLARPLLASLDFQ